MHAEWLTAALQTMSVAALRERGPFLSELAAVCVVFLSDDSLVRVSRALETLLCLTQVCRIQCSFRLSPDSGRFVALSSSSVLSSAVPRRGGLTPLSSVHLVRRSLCTTGRRLSLLRLVGRRPTHCNVALHVRLRRSALPLWSPPQHILRKRLTEDTLAMLEVLGGGVTHAPAFFTRLVKDASALAANTGLPLPVRRLSLQVLGVTLTYRASVNRNALTAYFINPPLFEPLMAAIADRYYGPLQPHALLLLALLLGWRESRNPYHTLLHDASGANLAALLAAVTRTLQPPLPPPPSAFDPFGFDVTAASASTGEGATDTVRDMPLLTEYRVNSSIVIDHRVCEDETRESSRILGAYTKCVLMVSSR